jgi:hypothetical protein
MHLSHSNGFLLVGHEKQSTLLAHLSMINCLVVTHEANMTVIVEFIRFVDQTARVLFLLASKSNKIEQNKIANEHEYE